MNKQLRPSRNIIILALFSSIASTHGMFASSSPSYNPTAGSPGSPDSPSGVTDGRLFAKHFADNIFDYCEAHPIDPGVTNSINLINDLGIATNYLMNNFNRIEERRFGRVKMSLFHCTKIIIELQ
jgi:hypothetical protein